MSICIVSRREDPWVQDDTGWVCAQSPASLTEHHVLVRAVTARDNDCAYTLMQRSMDNGQTWPESEAILRDEPLEDDMFRSWQVSSIYLDPENGLLVKFLLGKTMMTHMDQFTISQTYGNRTGRMFYEVSRDTGKTWGPRQQVIEAGNGYDACHWARDVWYGHSSLVLDGPKVNRRPDGTIVAACYLWPTEEDIHRIFLQEKRPDELCNDRTHYMHGLCLIGHWRDDLSALDFRSGGPMLVPGGYTNAGTGGTAEPAIAYLDDGRWFAILRTRTERHYAFRAKNIPVLPYCLLSEDNGRTWADPRPLTYQDGSSVYTPTAYSEFIRSSKNGKWYWIGNIRPDPSYGTCDYRYPLQIAEFDPDTLSIKRDTCTVIEDRLPDGPEYTRLSNFRVYEERQTGDFVLVMTVGYGEYQPGRDKLPNPRYYYRIRVTD